MSLMDLIFSRRTKPPQSQFIEAVTNELTTGNEGDYELETINSGGNGMAAAKSKSVHVASHLSWSDEIITPEVADQYLSTTNWGNRPIRRKHVESLARQMSMGMWKMNGEPIQFASNGRLLNGQHRLTAVLLAKTPVRMMVVRGLEEDTFSTLDQGAKRSASDTLSGAGIVQATKVAAAVRLIITWNQLLPTRNNTISKNEMLDFVRQHPEIQQIVSKIDTARPPVSMSALSAVGWMATASGEYADKWSEFLAKLSSGAELEKGSPILALRNVTLNLRRGSSLNVDTWFGLISTAWNDFVAGRTRRSMRVYKVAQWPTEITGYPVTRDPQKVTAPFTYTNAQRRTAPNPNVLTAVR